MSVPKTTVDFLALVRKSEVVSSELLTPFERRVAADNTPFPNPKRLAKVMISEGLLSYLQASLLLRGKWRNFVLCKKYKILEHLGAGGMGQVFLCEHKRMRRLVAVKIMAADKSSDEILVQRFDREARAAAALNHPNIVRAIDIDRDNHLHFIVMEYVDGASLHEIVAKRGPLSIPRACDYIRQASLALQHAHENRLVHRDIKPANLLLERTGLIKVHDLGLALSFREDQNITAHLGRGSLIGTADYLAPEQAINSHGVDIRADIYSLGGTFYYLLTGRSPFPDGTVAQKLMLHQNRIPDPPSTFRSEVPRELDAVIMRMLAKDPADRYQQPIDVVAALEPWTQTPIPPPDENDIPRRSRAVRRIETPATPLPPGLRPVSGSAGISAASLTPVPTGLQRLRAQPPKGLLAAIAVGLFGAVSVYGLVLLARAIFR